MAKSKSTKKKKKSGGQGGGAVQQFFVWHGEKIVVVVVVIVALWLAFQGLGGYQALTWQPSELESVSTEAEAAIKANTRTAEAEGIKIFDYEAYAGQIKEPIPTDPYRAVSAWLPAMSPARPTATVTPPQ